MFEAVERYIATQFKALAVFPLLMTDNPSADDVIVRVDYPERVSRLLVILRIPASYIVQPMVLGAMFTLYLIAFFAWWAILFTGRYPRTLFDFSHSVLRWVARATVWEWGLRDEWSLFAAPKQVWAAVVVGTVAVVALFGSGIGVSLGFGLQAASEGEAVVLSFVQAGKASDVEGATGLTAEPAEVRRQIADLFNNRYLFDDFISLKRTGWFWEKTTGQPETLNLDGDLIYEQGPKGEFTAFLVKVEDEWKIAGININRSP